MHRGVLFCLVTKTMIAFFSLFLLFFGIAFSQQQDSSSGFSYDQAKTEGSDIETQERARPIIVAGPHIEFMYPPVRTTDVGKTIETQSPAILNIAFLRSETGHPVDMSTLKIVGIKGWFRRTLTEKVRPYLNGTHIEIGDIKLPAGKFHLIVSIADTAGVKTVEDYILVVR
jgi:hypothetical protein